jgi:cytoskeletal protein RodZ
MTKTKMTTRIGSLKLLLSAAVVLTFLCGVQALSLQSSVFHGRSLVTSSSPTYSGSSSSSSSGITMRKQKASDRRTRKRQRGEIEDERMEAVGSYSTTLTTSPMSAAGAWKQKASRISMQPSYAQLQQATGAAAAEAVYGDSAPTSTGTTAPARKRTPGRGRSRKRSTLYNSLAFYHNKFLLLLTDEYQAEVRNDSIEIMNICS